MYANGDVIQVLKLHNHGSRPVVLISTPDYAVFVLLWQNKHDLE